MFSAYKHYSASKNHDTNVIAHSLYGMAAPIRGPGLGTPRGVRPFLCSLARLAHYSFPSQASDETKEPHTMNSNLDSLLFATFTSLLTGFVWTLTATVTDIIEGDEPGRCIDTHRVDLVGAVMDGTSLSIDLVEGEDDAVEALSLALGFGAWDRRTGCDAMRAVIDPLFIVQHCARALTS